MTRFLGLIYYGTGQVYPKTLPDFQFFTEIERKNHIESEWKHFSVSQKTGNTGTILDLSLSFHNILSKFLELMSGQQSS